MSEPTPESGSPKKPGEKPRDNQNDEVAGTLRIPDALTVSPRTHHLSLIWLIPVIAILIGLGLVIKNISETGPTIHIQFKTAEGLEAGKTKIKYKNVDIGDVKSITLAPDGNGVIVTAAMSREAGRLLVEDSRFWIVRPRVAGGQVSGLGTLLSGSYIGVDLGKSHESQREFTGLDTPPAVTTDQPGREFILRGSDLGSLDIGSPVYFRRIQVGEVTATELDRDGGGVTLKLFVHSPYEKFVTENTRFWHASGLDVSLDASGIKLQTQSLVSILLGGVAFQSPPEVPAGPQAKSDASFTLFDNVGLAMKRTDAEVTTLVAYFSESVRGLSPGAPVDFRGVTIGEVKSIDLEFEPDKKEFRFPVEISVYPDRLRSRHGGPVPPLEQRDALLARSIERGLRAQLRTGNLLTGQRYVALDFFKDAKPVKFDPSRTPLEMPTVPGSLEDLQLALTDIAKKLDKVPFDEIAVDLRQTMASLRTTLASTDGLVKHLDSDVAPQITATLTEAKKTLASADHLLASDAPVQQDVREALRELTRAAQSLRELTDYVQRHPESFLRGKTADRSPDAAAPETAK